MHDFHLADQIVKTAREHARKHNLARIEKIAIELGEVVEHGEAIKPKNLKYNINLLLPRCEIKIKKIEGSDWKLTSIDGMPFQRA